MVHPCYGSCVMEIKFVFLALWVLSTVVIAVSQIWWRRPVMGKMDWRHPRDLHLLVNCMLWMTMMNLSLTNCGDL